jgi:hypothetical protein
VARDVWPRDQGRLAAAQGRGNAGRGFVERNHSAFAVEHDRGTGKTLDELLDQYGLRRGKCPVGYRHDARGTRDSRLAG